MTGRLGRWSIRSALAAGLAVSLVLGAGVVALLSDVVTISPITLSSGEVDLAHDVRVGFADGADPTCAEGVDGPITGLVRDLEFDVVRQDRVNATAAPLELCLANVGAVPARIDIEWTLLSDAESGACTDVERELGGDVTCEDGDDGELVELLPRWRLRAEADCTDSSTGQFSGGGVVVPLRMSFDAGASCSRLGLTPFLRGLTLEQAARAQTDSVVLEIRVIATDVR